MLRYIRGYPFFILILTIIKILQIATLPVQYGLYSSFTGVLMYCFFATSKDITIGIILFLSVSNSNY